MQAFTFDSGVTVLTVIIPAGWTYFQFHGFRYRLALVEGQPRWICDGVAKQPEIKC